MKMPNKLNFVDEVNELEQVRGKKGVKKANIIYKNAQDITSMMQEGEYFTIKQLVDEFQLIGITIKKEAIKLKEKYNSNVTKKNLSEIMELSNFFITLDKKSKNQKILNKANKIKRLTISIIKTKSGFFKKDFKIN